MMSNVEVAALSDLGCVRTNNEDSFGYDPARHVYVVCDGMGGMASGEVASQLAVSTFLATVDAADGSLPMEMVLQQAISAANKAVYEAGLDPAHKGMGTTLVSAAIEDDKLLIGNIGDSRAYMIQNGQCMQVTVDHSYLNELIRVGAVAVEDAHSVDLKGMESVITRAIGVSAAAEPDFFSLDLTPGDIILLASDGLTRYASTAEICQYVTEDISSSCQRLIGLARERGGADNITCLLLRVAAASA